jgi:hypothetical protein
MTTGKTLQDYERDKVFTLEYINHPEKEKIIVQELRKFFLSSVNIEILLSHKGKTPLDSTKGAVQEQVSYLLH